MTVTLAEKSVLAQELQKTSGDWPYISVVMIGRNEARNLPLCIQSLREMDYPAARVELLYVDTDSNDGSPDVARSLGVTVHEEHSDFPSPGRARNRGWREARYDLVHFIDGDMTIGRDYLKAAVQCLGQAQVVCVIGLLDERNKQQNLFSRIMHYNWEVKVPGDIDAPGAGGTFLRQVLVETGGYNPNMLQSEETDLGRRLRDKGYRIILIQHLMGIHDYDVTTLGSVIRRFYHSTGSNYGKLLKLPPTPGLAPEQRAARRNLMQSIGALIGVAALLLLGLWFVIPLIILLIPLYILIKYWRPAERRWQRIAYFMMTYSAKPVIWAGMLHFLWRNRMAQRGSR